MIATMAMETTMARGTTSTFSPTATSWEEMWRNFSPISSLNFSSPKRSVNDVSVFSTSMILFLCCSLEWQKWTQAIFYFDLGTYGGCRLVEWGPGNLTFLSSRFLAQWIPQITSDSKWTRTEMRDFTACKVKTTTISFGNNIMPVQIKLRHLCGNIILLYPSIMHH